jgi:hypothetical protein
LVLHGLPTRCVEKSRLVLELLAAEVDGVCQFNFNLTPRLDVAAVS